MTRSFPRPTLRVALYSFFTVLSAVAGSPAMAAPLILDDVQYWVGSGSNRAGLVIDWNDGKSTESLAWGYRWNGTATSYDMFSAIVAADPRLYARVDVAGGFGVPIYGLGYNLDNDGSFGVSPSITFDITGLSVGSPSDGRTPTDTDDRWKEGWFSDGFWGSYNSDSGTTPTWSFASSGNTSRVLSNGSWDGLSYAPGFSDSMPSDAVAAVPEPAGLAVVGLAAFVLFRRRRAIVGSTVLAVLAGVVVLQAPNSAQAYVFDSNDFAVEVVSSTGLPNTTLYNDPQSVLGRPTLKFNNGTLASPDYRRAKLIESTFNTGTAGEKLITTLSSGTQITVRMGRPVTNDANNPFGIDFIVFGNAFFSGTGGFISDATDLSSFTLNGGILSESVKVSVSPDGTNWYRYESGPYGDDAFPTNSYLWDSNAGAWTNTEADPTLPVDPAMQSQVAGNTAAYVLDNIYAGSAGGAGFDLTASGFSSIQFIRVEGLSGFDTGEIDAFADVRAVPEPSALGLVGALAFGLLARRG